MSNDKERKGSIAGTDWVKASEASIEIRCRIVRPACPADALNFCQRAEPESDAFTASARANRGDYGADRCIPTADRLMAGRVFGELYFHGEHDHWGIW
jgi:hypothetical protein